MYSVLHILCWLSHLRLSHPRLSTSHSHLISSDSTIKHRVSSVSSCLIHHKHDHDTRTIRDGEWTPSLPRTWTQVWIHDRGRKFITVNGKWSSSRQFG
ncbi:hypothetical protein BDW68DRAFT_157118 [Aspergillus falconensis]